MAAATDSADTARTGESSYSALMLCDPLSCSQGTEIVRMEIPVTPFDGSGENQQLRMADVVVDYNGLVRAVRLVN
jgi:hypothetical protein